MELQKVLIIGAGVGGTAILKLINTVENMDVIGVVDVDETAGGLKYARELGVPIGTDWRNFVKYAPDLLFDVTGNPTVFKELQGELPADTILIPGSVANLIYRLMRDNIHYIEKLHKETHKYNTIFNSLGEGMIGIDSNGTINFFNKSAERMIGVTASEAIGQPIANVIPFSQLPKVCKTKKAELNKELSLSNGLKIVTSRFPLIDESGSIIGAFAVFRDMSEVREMAEEITNLKEIQTMLQAIIQSSDDAITVVDREGNGLMINPAYTRITGLTEHDVIGKPATVDITEGESIHYKVLQTKKPIRGVNMKVGASKREVIVNVAPVIVDSELKGSVGVIHDMTEMRNLTKELDKARSLIRTLESKYTFEDIIGDSPEMAISVEQAKLAAKTPVTVLLRGESGTGKELFAHAIHSASDRRYNKFIRVNCAAISEELLESELFGYEEGAFTGARKGGKKGLFEEADQGSIFLDEIGELSLNTQAKLLRVLQENEIVRVGGTKPVSISVRIIAATNVNLEKAIHTNTFREDLYYRLNRMPIQIPPLRNRKKDIPQIAERLLFKLNQEYGRNIEGLTESAILRLQSYDWPGNVRELENVISRAMIFMSPNEKLLSAENLMLSMNPQSIEGDPSVDLDSGPLSTQLDRYERTILAETLNAMKGNKSLTAQKLGISLRSLYYKLDKYNLQ